MVDRKNRKGGSIEKIKKVLTKEKYGGNMSIVAAEQRRTAVEQKMKNKLKKLLTNIEKRDNL